MQRNLILDVLIVLGFWFLVLYLFSGASITDFGLYASGIPIIWAVGWLAGGLVGTNAKLIRWYRSRHLADAPDDFAKATIMAKISPAEFVDVTLPKANQPKRDFDYLGRAGFLRRHVGLRSAGKLKIRPEDVVEDWASYSSRHPEYAQAIIAILQVMASAPELKASPYDGHGGLTLYEHSINVVKAMRQVAPGWQFRGVFDSKGRIVVPLQDASSVYHSFDPEDPMLPLVALAHDIGKLECYAIKPSGQIEEVKKDHGSVGSQMLRRIPEVMALELRERDALILAVEFYHHMNDLLTSKWVGDRVRSLTGLLYQADCLASYLEGDKNPDKVKAHQEYLEQLQGQRGQAGPKDPTPARRSPSNVPEGPGETHDQPHVEPQAAASTADPVSSTVTSAPTPASSEPDDSVDPINQQEPQAEASYDPLAMLYSDQEATENDPDVPVDDTTNQAAAKDLPGDDGDEDDGPQERFVRAANDPPVWVSKQGLDPIEMLVETLREPSRINGKDHQARIAWKQGKFLYIYERWMRHAVGKRFDDASIIEDRQEGNAYTKEVMRRLQATGDLVDAFEDMVFSYKRALFRVDMGNTTGPASKKNANPVMLIASATALGFDHLDDGARTPVIDAPFWGKSSAFGKKKKGSIENIEREDLTQENFMRWILANPQESRAVRANHIGKPCWVMREEHARERFIFAMDDLPERNQETLSADHGEVDISPAPVGKFFGSNAQSWFISVMENM